MPSCDFCGRHAPVTPVTFRQNTGMIVIRQYRAVEGAACRDCGKQLFVRMTLHTFLLGWWGTISFVMTPFLLVANVVNGFRVLRLPSAEVVAAASLREHADYARRLLATKDRDTVVEVLSRATGARPSDVADFVAELGPVPDALPVTALVHHGGARAIQEPL